MTRPSSTPDTVDKTLHSVGTVLFHLIGHVAIDIQCKCCCGVSQISLYRLDVISGLKRSNRIGVSQIMKAHVRIAKFYNNRLEMIVHCIRIQVLAEFVGEDKIHWILETLSIKS